MSIPGYITAQEIAAMCGVSRAAVHAAAGRHGWARYRVGRSILFPWAGQVASYIEAHERTRLLAALGVVPPVGGGGSLVWGDEPDIDCPECGAAAVELDDGRWLCVDGHTAGEK